MSSHSKCGSALCAAFAFFLTTQASAAQQGGSVTGTVSDPLGGRVASASVTLLRDGQSAGQATTDEAGEFTIPRVSEGRYQVKAEAGGFEPRTTDPLFVAGSGRTSIDVVLSVGPLAEAVVVSAAATEVPASRTGAPITVIDTQILEALNKPDVLEALRLVPGAQIVQTGQRGGSTSMFVRGGNSNFNKILIDGVAANDIGGGFDFAHMATAGVERIEVLRQSNSVMYGTDALSGVVNIITRRGRTRVPQADLSADGGNFNTRRASAALGGAVKRFDYFSEYAYFNTDNSTPNNAYRNGTYAGRFGVAIGRGTDLSGTIRRVDAKFGSPNGIDLYGIADDSSQKNTINYASIGTESQHTDRWQSTIRFGNTDFRSIFTNPTPTGQPFDPFGFGANYLGNSMTLTGANGYSVTGRAILDFGGTYPSVFRSRTRRRALFADTTYHVGRDFDISGGGRIEREEGFTNPDADPTATRDNGGVFAEARGSVAMRTYVTAGVGFEHNEAFDNAVTPRLSVATYLRNPSAASPVGDTKVSFNVGKGIKAPSVFQEQNALFTLVQATPAAANASPLGPERSTSIDVGVEQGLWYGRARVRTAYFHNEYTDLIEFLSRTQLAQAGVPAAVAAATQFGAYLNSSSFRAQGVETSFDAAIGPYVRMNASYTYLDAVVTKAFSAVAATNPSIPGVQIGAFSPLVGQRPFRRPPQSGSVMVSVMRGPGQVTFSGYFSGKRDDSTFLSDGFFGDSLLLPNRDLDRAYQKLDLSASYRVHRRVSLYTSIENILDKKYDASFGFPSLPRAARAGARITVGGN
ncbi:MAG TPA: TonB-dependent receptor [Vicinamibacterales bacterium]|jgi:iron complex outermembrane receptor protein/vitamin B12 transporter